MALLHCVVVWVRNVLKLQFLVTSIRRSREVMQSWSSTVWSTFVASLSSLFLIFRSQPDLVSWMFVSKISLCEDRKKEIQIWIRSFFLFPLLLPFPTPLHLLPSPLFSLVSLPVSRCLPPNPARGWERTVSFHMEPCLHAVSGAFWVEKHAPVIVLLMMFSYNQTTKFC